MVIKINKIVKVILIVSFWWIGQISYGQIKTPVRWSYAAKKINAMEAVVLIRATIEEGWHIYSVNQEDGGPVKTSFAFSASKDYALIGGVTEPKPNEAFEKAFNINVKTFERSVVFQQKIRLKGGHCVVSGSLEYMVCNDHECLPRETVAFSIPVK